MLLLTLAISDHHRRLGRYRKQLAALFSARYGLGPGGLSALLEDDDAFALLAERFLGEHHVPYTLPLYDRDGRYLFASPAKVGVLASALLRAVGRGRDNELFVLLADLLELDDALGPLLKAVRVAVSRHHQVVLVAPWPAGMRLPAEKGPEDDESSGAVSALVGRATTRRFHRAYHRIRRTFARLGVQVVCAAGEAPAALILDRLNRLRRGEATMKPDAPPPRPQPGVSAYTILCLTALMGMVLALMENDRDLLWILLLAAVGAAAVIARWRIGPPLVVLGLATLEVFHLAAGSVYGRTPFSEESPFMDAVLAASVLAYAAGHYRLLSLAHSIFPVDVRRPPPPPGGGKPSNPRGQRRSAELPGPWELPMLATAAGVWAVGVTLFWLALSAADPPLDLSRGLGAGCCSSSWSG